MLATLRAARASRTMSRTPTVATLPRLSASALSELILAEKDSENPSFAIIDVRDDDYIGGHIKGATNVPSRTVDAMLPTLIRQLESKQTVVFHCALSQVRGPAAALKYLRRRDEILSRRWAAAQAKGEEGAEQHSHQTIVVLERGFVGWQEVHGEDERLTEGYSKELWKDGYWM